MKKLLALTLVTLMLASMLAGCTPKPEPTTPPAAVVKDTITFLAWIKHESFDPLSQALMEPIATFALFDQLIKYADDGNIVPSLAESWNETATDVTFKLREDVKFHDGSAFSADDVIYTFDTVMAHPRNASYMQYISGWEKVGNYTIKVTKTTPYANVLGMLAYTFVIAPKTAHAKDPAAFGSAPVGTGPFKFSAVGIDGTVELTANENYFAGAPAFAKAVIKAPLDPSTAVVALENGEVDIITHVPSELHSIVSGNNKLELVSGSTWAFNILVMEGEILSKDNNLRKAIFHAINRENLILVANGGIGEPAKAMMPAKILGDVKDQYTFVGYDEQLAKDFLGKSNYDPNYVFKITVSNPRFSTIAQSIQSDLKKIGVNVEVEQLDVNGWATKLLSDQIEMTIMGFYGILSNVEESVNFWHSNAPYFGANMQVPAEYDAIFAAMQTETNPAKRIELVKRGMAMQFELANYVPLFDSTATSAQSKSVAPIPLIQVAGGLYRIGDYKPR